MGEILYLQEKHLLAAEWIRQHPLGYTRAILRRAVYYWTGYWSLQRDYLDIEPTEIPMMFYICCVTLLALRGARRFWKWNRAAGMPYFVLVGIFPISYWLSLVLIDYRAQPIELAIVVLAMWPVQSRSSELAPQIGLAPNAPSTWRPTKPRPKNSLDYRFGLILYS